MDSEFDSFERFHTDPHKSTILSGLRNVKTNPKLPQHCSDYHKNPFVCLQSSPEKFNDMLEKSERTTNIHNSEVESMFFSKNNITRIQRLIKKRFFEKTDGEYKLDVDQDELKLHMVMTRVYSDQSRDLPTHIKTQVKELNELLVEYILPDMINEVIQYHGYIKDINEPIQPMMRPMHVSSAGTKSYGIASVYNM